MFDPKGTHAGNFHRPALLDPYSAAALELFYFVCRLRLRRGCDRPPVSFMGVPRRPGTVRRPSSCSRTDHQVPVGYPRADLATDLVRGKCASACSRSPGPPLMSCMPHRTGVPFVMTWAVAWGARPWQASGNPRCSTRGELTLGTSIGLPVLAPTAPAPLPPASVAGSFGADHGSAPDHKAPLTNSTYSPPTDCRPICAPST